MNGFMLADSASLDAPFNLAFYGHEISHQWWANLVSNAGGAHGNYMLDEAVAQFDSLRAVETLDGTLAAEQYRRSGYPGYNADQSGPEAMDAAVNADAAIGVRAGAQYWAPVLSPAKQ